MKSKSIFAFELVTMLVYTPITTQIIQRIKCLGKKDRSELFSNKCKDYEIRVLKEIVTECLKGCDKLLIKDLLKPSGYFGMSYLKKIVSSLYWFIGFCELDLNCEQLGQLEIQKKIDEVKRGISELISINRANRAYRWGEL